MKWRLICTVQSDQGITDPTTQGDEVIEAETPVAALIVWLCGQSYYQKAWLRCTSGDCGRLIRHNAAGSDELRGEHFEASGDTWDAHLFEFGDDYVDMAGTHCDGEYRYSVSVRSVSTEEIAYEARPVSSLTREQLEKIATYARDGLYLDLVEDREVYNLDKPVSGADYIQHMAAVLEECNLTPTRKE